MTAARGADRALRWVLPSGTNIELPSSRLAHRVVGCRHPRTRETKVLVKRRLGRWNQFRLKTAVRRPSGPLAELVPEACGSTRIRPISRLEGTETDSRIAMQLLNLPRRSGPNWWASESQAENMASEYAGGLAYCNTNLRAHCSACPSGRDSAPDLVVISVDTSGRMKERDNSSMKVRPRSDEFRGVATGCAFDLLLLCFAVGRRRSIISDSQNS